MNKTPIISLSLLLIVNATQIMAQDDSPGAACQEAVRLFEQDQIDEALEEARWCVEGLEQLKQQATVSIFPDEINGFVGDKIKSQNTFGMSMMERTYSKDAEIIEVSFTGSGAGSGLAAIARMGMSMGGAGKKLRIQRHVVLDSSDGQKSQFMVTMKSGGMLNVSSSNADYEDVLEFLKQFPIKALDKAVEK